jgi:hypothetical protein
MTIGKPFQSGNHGGRSKMLAEVQELARQHTTDEARRLQLQREFQPRTHCSIEAMEKSLSTSTSRERAARSSVNACQTFPRP